jgi:hypothetical protein
MCYLSYVDNTYAVDFFKNTKSMGFEGVFMGPKSVYIKSVREPVGWGTLLRRRAYPRK